VVLPGRVNPVFSKMRHHTREKIAWFVRNLDWQMEDVELEKALVGVDTYFDTADVTDFALGMEAFFTPGGDFQIKNFLLERTLVNCLAASGMLGPIRMLPPHQSEFLHGLIFDFGIPSVSESPTDLASRFLRLISESGAIKYTPLPLEAMTGEEILELVRRGTGSAVSLFKAIQCMRGGSWKARLVKLKQMGILNLDVKEHNYSSIINSPEFVRLKECFDARRPFSRVSNFADATAVACLIALVNEYKNGDSDRVPHFFVSSPVFRDAVKEAEVESLLEYKTREGIIGSVLRDADYFVFKSIFRANNLYRQGASPAMPDEPMNLNHLRAQLEDILKAQQAVDAEVLDGIVVSGVPLNQLIEDLHRLSFFEKVWLPFSAKDEILTTLHELNEATSQLKSEKFQKVIGDAIKATKQALAENAREYQRVNSLWSSLERASQPMLVHLRDYPTHNLDFFRDFGLLRFAFPASSHKTINRIIAALISGDEEAEKYARGMVINACLTQCEDREQGLVNLVVAAAVFWVLGMDEQIIDILGKVNPLPHFSLRIVYAAAIFRKGENVKAGESVLIQLTEGYRRVKDQHMRADMAVGIAYLYFRLFLQKQSAASWRGHVEAARPSDKKMIDEAIRYAHEAYILLGEEDIMKKVYALNQHLYYLVEGNSDNLGDTISHVALLLVNHKSNRAVWGYRYDDTLARYFYKLAAEAADEGRWTELMEIARSHVNQAAAASSGDEEIKSFKSFLEVKFVAGFPKS